MHHRILPSRPSDCSTRKIAPPRESWDSPGRAMLRAGIRRLDPGVGPGLRFLHAPAPETACDDGDRAKVGRAPAEARGPSAAARRAGPPASPGPDRPDIGRDAQNRRRNGYGPSGPCRIDGPARPVRLAPAGGRIGGTVVSEGGRLSAGRPGAGGGRATRVRRARGHRPAGVRPRPTGPARRRPRPDRDHSAGRRARRGPGSAVGGLIVPTVRARTAVAGTAPSRVAPRLPHDSRAACPPSPAQKRDCSPRPLVS